MDANVTLSVFNAVYPRVCGVDSLVFNVFNAMRGLFMQIAYLFSGRIVFGFRRSGH